MPGHKYLSRADAVAACHPQALFLPLFLLLPFFLSINRNELKSQLLWKLSIASHLTPLGPIPPRYIYEMHWLSFYAGKGKISALFNIPFPEFLYLCIDWLASQGISSCSHLLKAIGKLSIYGGERQIKGILRSIAKMFNLPHIL